GVLSFKVGAPKISLLGTTWWPKRTLRWLLITLKFSGLFAARRLRKPMSRLLLSGIWTSTP
ncbi:hypothetical protein A2U01_0116202, partial [Trifolium medium]|nr:hypothetical protein [Trifolium medium]